MIFFRTHYQQPQRRGAKPFRAASCRWWGHAFLSVLAGAVLVAGCAPNSNLDSAPTKTQSAPNRASQKPAASITSSQPNALTRWWNAITKPSKSAASKHAGSNQSKIPIVAIDVAAIAADHPAWKLANAIERTSGPAIRFDPLAGTGDSRMAIAAPSFDVGFEEQPKDERRAQTTTNAEAQAASATSEEFFPDAQNISPGLATVADLADTEAAIAEEERESVAQFLLSVGQRQTDWRKNYATVLETALDEEIAAMQRAPVEALPLPLPSADSQLEMTNLQLQLSRNIFLTEPERAAARARLDALMGQWRAALTNQRQERLEELQRLRVEEPRKARAAGLQRITEELAAIEELQQEISVATWNEHRARVEQDFGDENARLGIVLPTEGVLPLPAEKVPATSDSAGPREISALLGSAFQEFEAGSNLVFARTNSSAVSSVRAESGMADGQVRAEPGSKAFRIQELRNLAMRETIKQIQMISRRAGWQWRSTAQLQKRGAAGKFPDRTRETWQMLDGS